MGVIKKLLRFEDLEKEVFEPNKTLVITDSDADGTKCSQNLKEKFPLAEYFYVDARIASVGSTPPSEGDVYEVLNETKAKLVIIADIGEVYFWKDLILDKAEKNPELKTVIFDHHYLVKVRKKRIHSLRTISISHADSLESRQVRGAFYALNEHPRISFYWDHVCNTYPMVRKWLRGELDNVLRKNPLTTVCFCKHCGLIVPIDQKKNHFIKCIGLNEDEAKKGNDRIEKLLASSFGKARVEFAE